MKRLTILFILNLFVATSFAQKPLSKQYFLSEDNVAVRINTLCQNDDGYILLGTDNGLYRFNGSKFVQISTPPAMKRKSPITALVKGIGRTWLGFENGNFGYYQKDSIHLIALGNAINNHSIKSIFAPSNSEYWIGTDDGLFHFKNKILKKYSQEQGLSDNYIYKIVPDKGGTIWLATDNGINALYQKNGKITIRSFNTESTLKDEIVSSVVLLDDQHLLLGAEKGTFAMLDIKESKLHGLAVNTMLGPITNI